MEEKIKIMIVPSLKAEWEARRLGEKLADLGYEINFIEGAFGEIVGLKELSNVEYLTWKPDLIVAIGVGCITVGTFVKAMRIMLNPDFHYSDFLKEWVNDHKKSIECGVYQVGILAVDPINMRRDYKRDASSLSDYQLLLTHRRWKDITMKFDAPIVAYMLFSEKEFETPEKYPNAEQYVFEPDFDQRADWALSKRIVPPFLIDFIKGDGNRDGIMYRWYNLFNTQNEETDINFRGVIYPKKWYKVLNDCSSIDDVTDAVIKDVSRVNGISTDIADQLKKFIHEYHVGISS